MKIQCNFWITTSLGTGKLCRYLGVSLFQGSTSSRWRPKGAWWDVRECKKCDVWTRYCDKTPPKTHQNMKFSCCRSTLPVSLSQWYVLSTLSLFWSLTASEPRETIAARLVIIVHKTTGPAFVSLVTVSGQGDIPSSIHEWIPLIFNDAIRIPQVFVIRHIPITLEREFFSLISKR